MGWSSVRGLWWGGGGLTPCLSFFWGGGLIFREGADTPALYVNKQQKLDADPKAIQQINFTGNLKRNGNTQMFFIIGEAKETVLDFSKGIMKVL